MGETLGWNCCRHIEGAPRMVHFWRSGSGFRVFLQGFLGVYHHPDWSERWRCDDLENPMVGIVEAIPREKRWLFGHKNSCQQGLDGGRTTKGKQWGYSMRCPQCCCLLVGGCKCFMRGNRSKSNSVTQCVPWCCRSMTKAEGLHLFWYCVEAKKRMPKLLRCQRACAKSQKEEKPKRRTPRHQSPGR